MSVQVVKIADKNLNLSLLLDQIRAAGLTQEGLLVAGFEHVGSQRYRPFTVRTVIGKSGDVEDFADPGELRFRFPDPLTGAEDTALDGVLTAHDATQSSSDQQNKQADQDAIAPLVANYRDWATLTDAQKDNNARQVTRLVARLLDSTQDL
ncbi:MAG: hypothetical protein KAJ42_14275 [Gemmatimonadetes bacterium]|nr:hypothetical protein [Gemmatimonadota bacterium]